MARSHHDPEVTRVVVVDRRAVRAGEPNSVVGTTAVRSTGLELPLTNRRSKDVFGPTITPRP
jgi:hypothetical protein